MSAEDFLGAVGGLGSLAYVVIGLLALLESSAFIGLVVPGETAVLLGGFLAGQGRIAVGGVVAAASVGAALGDSAGYEIGRRFGRPLVVRHGHRLRIRRGQLEAAERIFATWGGSAVFFGRFIGFLRAFVPFLAGTSCMPYSRFLVFNVAGGVLWAGAITALGYFFGANWPALERLVGRAGLIAAAVVLAMLWALRARRRPS